MRCSVCIVLEICYYGSLSDVIRGVNFPPEGSRGRDGSVRVHSHSGHSGSVTAGLLNVMQGAFPATSRASFGPDGSIGGGSSSRGSFANVVGATYDSDNASSSRAPLNLSLSDKYFLALGESLGTRRH